MEPIITEPSMNPNRHENTVQELVHRLRCQLILDSVNSQELQGHSLREIGQYYCYDLAPGLYTFVLFRPVAPCGKEQESDIADLLRHLETRGRQLCAEQFHESEIYGEKWRSTLYLFCHQPCQNPEADATQEEIARFRQSVSLVAADLVTLSQVEHYNLLVGRDIITSNPGEFRDSVRAAWGDVNYVNSQISGSPIANQIPDWIAMGDILPKSRRGDLYNAIERLDYNAMDKWIHDLLEDAKKLPGSAIHLAHYTLNLAHSAVIYLTLAPPQLDEELERCQEALRQHLQLPDLEEDLKAAIRRIIHPYTKESAIRERLPILTAKQYIHTNYQSDISLKEVADHVHLSASYFSALFKLETGYTFTDYVTNLRIHTAQNMLATTYASIQDISEAVGYHDSKYFSRIFKKATGMTPLKYRQENKLGRKEK